MASMNYFDSKRKNPTYVLKQKSVMERHVITKSTNIHDYSCFCLFCCVCVFVCLFFLCLCFCFCFACFGFYCLFVLCGFLLFVVCFVFVLFYNLANKLKTL